MLTRNTYFLTMKINTEKFSLGLGFSFFALSAFFLAGKMRLNYVYAVVFSLFHEIGHLVSVKFFGGRITGISLDAAGIKIEKSHGTLSYHAECITALCGPLVNLLFSFLFCVLKMENDCFTLPFYINTGLFVVNILPLGNLDGGRFVKYAILELSDEEKARRILRLCEISVLVLLVSVLVLSLIFDFVNTSFVFFLVSLSIMTVSDLVKS